MRHPFRLGLLPVCLAFAATTAAAAEATVSAATSLLAEPNPAATVVVALPADAKVQTLEKQGFWQKVRAGDKEGWLKLTSIRLAGKSSITLSGLAAVGTGRAGTGSVVSTSGTRGLKQQDLVNAQPDAEAMAAVDAVTIAPEDVASFAQAGGLQSRQLPYVTKQKKEQAAQ
jgi:hypothetical protein